MDGKKIALLVGALFVAAFTAIMAKNMFGASATPLAVAAAPQPTGPQVLVATKALPVGTILGPGDVRFRPWPKQLVDGAYFVRGAAGADPVKLQGMVVRNAVTAGQPVTQGALVSPKDRGFLAAALTPGMRAITVAVNNTSGVAGFVFPGDRIDLMLTQTVTGAGEPLNATETFARNIRVLATDQRYQNQPTDDGKPDVKSYSMVTLEVTPKLAEKIEVAEKIGSLSLALRPLADNTQELAEATADGDKTPLLLAGQPQDANPTFTTGGQVSRFQRNTMPLQTGQNVPPQNFGDGAAGAAGQADAAYTGPAVRVARGNTVTITPVGGK